MLTVPMKQRPVFTITLYSVGLQCDIGALLDTGADITTVAQQCWPQSWPLECVDKGVEGVGGAVMRTAVLLLCPYQLGYPPWWAEMFWINSG